MNRLFFPRMALFLLCTTPSAGITAHARHGTPPARTRNLFLCLALLLFILPAPRAAGAGEQDQFILRERKKKIRDDEAPVLKPRPGYATLVLYHDPASTVYRLQINLIYAPHYSSIDLPRGEQVVLKLDSGKHIIAYQRFEKNGRLIVNLSPDETKRITLGFYPTASRTTNTDEHTQQSRSERTYRPAQRKTPEKNFLVPGYPVKATPRWSTNSPAPFTPLRLGLLGTAQLPGSGVSVIGVEFGLLACKSPNSFGVSVAGFVNDIGNNGGGLQFALAVARVGGNFGGLQTSLGYSAVEGSLAGVQFSLGGNLVKGDLIGLQAGGGIVTLLASLPTLFLIPLRFRESEPVAGTFPYRKEWGNYICGNLYGAQIGLWSNILLGSGGFLQLAPGSNKTSGSFYGIQVACLNYADRLLGLQAGLLNIARENSGPFQLGIVNLCRARFSGLQLGAVNITQTAVFSQIGLYNHSQLNRGLQIGIANITEGGSFGFQIGVGNKALLMRGFQIGAYNETRGVCRGLQIGAINQAGVARGLQIGIINYARQLRGVQIGLFNISMKNGLPFFPGINIGF